MITLASVSPQGGAQILHPPIKIERNSARVQIYRIMRQHSEQMTKQPTEVGKPGVIHSFLAHVYPAGWCLPKLAPDFQMPNDKKGRKRRDLVSRVLAWSMRRSPRRDTRGIDKLVPLLHARWLPADRRRCV